MSDFFKRIGFADLVVGVFIAGLSIAGAYAGFWFFPILIGGIVLSTLIATLVMKSRSAEEIIRINERQGEDKKLYVRKFKQADIRKGTSSFLLAGLAIAILSVIFAFNWKEPPPPEIPICLFPIVEDEGIEVTPPPTQPTPPTPPPPLPPEPPKTEPKIVTVEDFLDDIPTDILEKEVDVDTEVEVKKEIKKIAAVVKVIEDEPEPVTEPEIFVIVEQMPEFVGGQKEMMKFIYGNIKYPRMAVEAGIEGTVVIAFIVEKDGSISNVEIKREIGGGCGEEAKRVVDMMPQWNPGQQRGKAVRVMYNMPVVYKLK